MSNRTAARRINPEKAGGEEGGEYGFLSFLEMGIHW